MRITHASLDEFLGHVLRGAAKILGCNSTNLVVINEASRQIRVRLGVAAVDNPMLADLEEVMGDSFRGLSVELDKALDSLIYRVWRDGSMHESSRLSEVVGGGIPADMLGQFERMIGEHRFILVPAAGAHRNYGVLLFEKNGTASFSRQQREMLLRTARRIGAIIENDLMGQWRTALHPPAEPDRAGADPLEHQLLQLTLGEPAPAVFADPDLCITSCNEAAGRLFGQSPDELVGTRLDRFFREPEAVAAVLPGRMTDGVPGGGVRHVVRRLDHALTAVQLESLELVDDQKRVVGYLLLIHADNGTGAWSTEQLVQQERLATMGEIAAALAHEIRNPLLAVGATLESLGREQMGEQQKTLLESAAREITRLDLTLRKYLNQRLEMQFTEVGLAEVFQEVQRLLRGARKLAGKAIRVEVDPGLRIRADHDSLKHMFFNLVHNALEVSPRGGEVVCRAEDDGREVVACIEDRGPGLAVNSDTCFRPFFTTKENGSGMGLPVCRSIAQAHGGVIDLRNRDGGGCRATVVLPRDWTGNGGWLP